MASSLEGLFKELEFGERLHQRLDNLYAATGDGRQPSGGKDAYFIVRNPVAIDPSDATEQAIGWLTGVRMLAELVQDQVLLETLDPIPNIRVLEGLAPKHPKSEDEKSGLLKSLLNDATTLLQRIDSSQSYATALRPAYYYTACDYMLRDYLMWPLFAEKIQAVPDPYSHYFHLWTCGVKYRIFGNNQIDLYLPRR